MINEHQQKISQKCYKPKEELEAYLNRRLQFEKKQRKLTIAGEELSDQEKREGDNLRRMKVHILNTYVFPSMANLTFFFKSIAEHQQLEELFEDDILDLLGIRRNNPQKDDLGFMFYDLLDHILIGGKGGRYNEKKDDRIDFRLILNHIAQKIVCHKMRQSSVGILEMGGPRSVVMGDFHRVWAWTEMLSRVAEQGIDDEVPPARTFEFHTDELLLK